ncbi:tra2 [Acrasis kona]|uniref:Tra2 n=1 Tax=Acrasis kona TaxID=1008807 RepID=A0AAW2Z569_9EUKA
MQRFDECIANLRGVHEGLLKEKDLEIEKLLKKNLDYISLNKKLDEELHSSRLQIQKLQRKLDEEKEYNRKSQLKMHDSYHYNRSTTPNRSHTPTRSHTPNRSHTPTRSRTPIRGDATLSIDDLRSPNFKNTTTTEQIYIQIKNSLSDDEFQSLLYQIKSFNTGHQSIRTTLEQIEKVLGKDKQDLYHQVRHLLRK